MLTLAGLLLVLVGSALLAASMSRDGGEKRFLWLKRLLGDWKAIGEELGVTAALGTRGAAGAALGGALLFIVLFGGMGLLAAMAIFFFGPRFLRNYLKRRVLKRFEQLLPDALDTIASALRVGLSFPQAIQPLAQDFPEPIRSVFAEALRAVQVGTPVGEALKEAGRNYPTREWWIFVEAVSTLLRMGGNLAEITAKTADTLRRRQRIEERLRTLTAQGRLQAWIMGLLPLGMLFILKGLDPQLYSLLVGSFIGWVLLTLALLLEGVAIILIRRILALEV